MARNGAPAYLRGMARGHVPIWTAVALTLALGAFMFALWLGRQRDYFIVLAPGLPVVWAWWSAIKGLRERSDAKR
jgi:hypothetical protein